MHALVWPVSGTILVVLAVVWVFQSRLIYFPLPEPVAPAATTVPGAEEVSFTTEDGFRLRGWFVSPLRASRGTVLVFNGNAGDRSFRAPLAVALIQAGLSGCCSTTAATVATPATHPNADWWLMRAPRVPTSPDAKTLLPKSGVLRRVFGRRRSRSTGHRRPARGAHPAVPVHVAQRHGPR